MRQPVASVTAADVERLVLRDFAPAEHTTVRALLGSYGVESYEREVDRVRAALLRVADGRVGPLEDAVRVAKQDYRDALVMAEYPLYWKRTAETPDLPQHERADIHEADRRRYDEWFRRAAP
jgi:hypothetical protein